MLKSIFNYCLLFILGVLVCFGSMPTAHAVVSTVPASVSVDGGYSGVMADLQSSSKFFIDNYPVITDDYSLKVITAAKNNDGEFFVYVYQPSDAVLNLRATSINISIDSLDENGSKEFKNYKLSLINKSGVFYKYLVKGLMVDERYDYEISSIFRSYVNGVDSDVSGDNTSSEVSFPVGKIFSFVNGDLKVNDVDYITITDKYVGFVRYFGGSYIWVKNSCDSHFVAFSTDKQIERLLEADVFFQTQRLRKYTNLSGDYEEWLDNEPIDNYSYLTEDDEYFYSGQGFWKHNYSWDRIQTVDDFLASQDFENVYKGALSNETAEYKLNEESKNYIKTQQWVLRFYESNYEYNARDIANPFDMTPEVNTLLTRVFNVSVLRLKFETAGVIYDLGVVDNKQTGSFTPDNTSRVSYSLNDNIWSWLKKIIGILLLVVVLVICAPFILFIISLVVFVIKALLHFVGGIFKSFGKIFKRRGG